MTSNYDKLSKQLFKTIVFLISFKNCDDSSDMSAEILNELKFVIKDESRIHAI